MSSLSEKAPILLIASQF